MKRALLVISIIALAALPFIMKFGWEAHLAKRCMEEASDARAMKTEITEKLEAYQATTGAYPESLAALSFTNTPRRESHADFARFRYQRNQSGYILKYEGKYGCFL